ncbi:DNA repair protein RecO [Clostridia bacterium]|nr:DNA repair protein RecO [Clostridia bacterium]
MLREYIAGECDKYVVLLLRDYGKMTIRAKGAKRPKSKFQAITAPLDCAEFVIYQGNGFLALAGGSDIYHFDKIRGDYDKLCYAAYVLEMTERTIMEGEDCGGILDLLMRTLNVIERGNITLRLVRIIYEFKFLRINGYSPHIDDCAACGGELLGEVFFFEYGTACEKCRQGVALGETALYALSRILEDDNPFNFEIDETAANELRAAADLFIKAHNELELKSTQFLV